MSCKQIIIELNAEDVFPLSYAEFKNSVDRSFEGDFQGLCVYANNLKLQVHKYVIYLVHLRQHDMNRDRIRDYEVFIKRMDNALNTINNYITWNKIRYE